MHLKTHQKMSMYLGNACEHYDNALFALLSPFIASQFFPEKDPLLALILTYAIIPLGMSVRPLGSLFFGFIGDKHGRNKALFISLTGMAFITGGMAFVPTYQQVGYIAPFLLSLGRVLQNFFTSGESIGGAIYLLENSPENEQSKMSSYFNASTVAGVIIASFGVATLSSYQLIDNGWRILYIFGCITAIFGWILRTQNENQLKLTIKIPFYTFFKESLKTCWHYREKVFVISVVSGFSYASYILALILINGLIPLVTEINKTQIMHLNTAMLIVDFLILIALGFITDRFSSEKLMIYSGISAFFMAIPLFWLLQDASYLLIILIRFVLVLIGVCFFAPFHAWSQKLIPVEHRYTVLSFAYALGVQLFGSTTAVISLGLLRETGWITSVAWYWMALGLASSCLIGFQKKLVCFEKNLEHSNPVIKF